MAKNTGAEKSPSFQPTRREGVIPDMWNTAQENSKKHRDILYILYMKTHGK